MIKWINIAYYIKECNSFYLRIFVFGCTWLSYCFLPTLAMMESDEIVENCLSELEKNALERRKRLKELRARLGANSQDGGEAGSNMDIDSEQPSVPLMFRSYKPVGSGDKASNLVNMREEIKGVEKNVADQIEASVETKVQDTLDLNTLAPRKADWDLRRAIDERLRKLDSRTNKAITQLIRNRMQEEGKGAESELLAVTVGSIGGP